MAEITKAISVDVAQINVFQAIVAKQNDSKSRYLEVTLTNEGVPLAITPTSTVTINALREDGESKSFSGTVNDNGTVVVPITNWMLALDGNVKCDITVFDTENRKLTTTLFTIAVEESANLGTEISEDENYDLLTQLLTDCTNAKNDCEAAAEQANSAVNNLSGTLATELENYVEKVDGKGLSTNDYTDSEKNQNSINATNIAALQQNKVDKVTGKGLSANDYTDEEKQKNAKNATDIEGINTSLTEYVKKTDYASESTAGVVKVRKLDGLKMGSSGLIQVDPATEGQITNRLSVNCPITPSNINATVKAALTDSNRITGMTDTEKANARNVIGAEKKTYVEAEIGNTSIVNVYVPYVGNHMKICDHDILTLTMYVDTTDVSVGYECAFSFQSGETATTITYPGDSFKFVGVDCDADGDFVPSANTNYEVSIRNLSTNTASPLLVARVGVY